MLKFYGYKQCGTCRKAMKALDGWGVDYRFIDITERPPGAGVLKRLARQAGVAPGKLFNTSGAQYRALKIKDRLPGMRDAEIYNLLAGNGRLIKRPIVTDGRRTTIGFQAEQFEKTWRGAAG